LADAAETLADSIGTPLDAAARGAYAPQLAAALELVETTGAIAAESEWSSVSLEQAIASASAFAPPPTGGTGLRRS
jgi:hypothetical protein